MGHEWWENTSKVNNYLSSASEWHFKTNDFLMEEMFLWEIWLYYPLVLKKRSPKFKVKNLTRIH